MTWAYINFYAVDFINWCLSFFGFLSVVLVLLTSFLNLLTEVAESFSTMVLTFFIIIPQINLLVTLQGLVSKKTLENTNTSNLSLVNLMQINTFKFYYSKNLFWIGR